MLQFNTCAIAMKDGCRFLLHMDTTGMYGTKFWSGLEKQCFCCVDLITRRKRWKLL